MRVESTHVCVKLDNSEMSKISKMPKNLKNPKSLKHVHMQRRQNTKTIQNTHLRPNDGALPHVHTLPFWSNAAPWLSDKLNCTMRVVVCVFVLFRRFRLLLIAVEFFECLFVSTPNPIFIFFSFSNTTRRGNTAVISSLLPPNPNCPYGSRSWEIKTWRNQEVGRMDFMDRIDRNGNINNTSI